MHTTASPAASASRVSSEWVSRMTDGQDEHVVGAQHLVEGVGVVGRQHVDGQAGEGIGGASVESWPEPVGRSAANVAPVGHRRGRGRRRRRSGRRRPSSDRARPRRGTGSGCRRRRGPGGRERPPARARPSPSAPPACRSRRRAGGRAPRRWRPARGRPRPTGRAPGRPTRSRASRAWPRWRRHGSSTWQAHTPASTTSEHGRSSRSTRNCREHSHQKSCMVTTTLAPVALAAGSSPAPRDCNEWKCTTSGACFWTWSRKSSVTAGLSQLCSSSQPIQGVVTIQCTSRPGLVGVVPRLEGARSPSQPA